MQLRRRTTIYALAACLALPAAAQQITGELKQWHDVVLTLDGPSTSESADPNPFLFYRLNVTFTKGSRQYVIPGYFAADGNASETSATAGNKWRVHFVPDEVGEWSYQVSFRSGADIAVDLNPGTGTPVPPDGLTGKITIGPSDKTGRDHRAQGTLRYVGEHYAQYAGSKQYFIQAGTQSPENFLAYAEFDATVDHGGAENRLKDGLHHFEPHVRDWRTGDPTWKGGKGKGIIGALNYLAGKGMNTFYSLTMNVDGDGREIYPWTSYEERARYDISKLAQWDLVFSHMDRLGMQLMLITQEEENEQMLGKMTVLRKLYYRELIARFAHHHAILWDLSEEMDRWRYYTTEDIKAICDYFKQLDPWQHPIQYVQWKGELLPDDKGYGRLLGFANFDGTAMQHDPEYTHPATTKWVDESAKAGHKWLVGVIEINPTSTGVLPDKDDYWHDTVRKDSIWGNLMAGGSGSVYFFGYAYPDSDLDLEDWRSRDHFWDLLHYAHDFFTRYLPFQQMRHDDTLTANADDYVFAKRGEVYAVYLPNGGSAGLDLSAAQGLFEVKWYDPRFGGQLQNGSVRAVQGGGIRSLGAPPNEPTKDWAVLVRPAPALLDKDRKFLVKLNTPIGSWLSKAGDAITASVISPESFLGATMQGTVERVSNADNGNVVITFRTLSYKDLTLPVTSVTAGFVNSKGHKGVDDEERPTTVEQGAFVTPKAVFLLNEGAEINLLVSPPR
ncbi:DUF5060 domain-containing protein [uncultured Paludibaculum sp.]|uniref:DUF5060 domain-containing protein n=1 Tax=uncultured Paludibaculum sp. TaxID=1765020 RepID=UPI002AAA9C8E|nr:DUF5060 domain-containing protein [uncultured Paludibaculum sp.]